MHCTHCGNQVKTETATCPYCQKPLTGAVAATSARSCISVAFTVLTIAAFAIASYFAFPEFWKNLLHKKDQTQPDKMERTAQTDRAELRAMYKRYLEAIRDPHPEKFEPFVQQGRVIELNEGGTKSLVYDQLVPDISMSGIEVSRVFLNGDRAIIVTQAQGSGELTDSNGNPIITIGIGKFLHEDDGWKLFSQTWHIGSPTDPVEDSKSWLTPKMNNPAASELLAIGVEYSDEACLDAISRSRTEVVKLCMKAGFSPHTPWMGQATAFDSAVSNISKGDPQNVEVIKAMLAAGANVDSTTGGALTPLMQAAMYCQPDFAQILINEGANVNFKNEQGLTPLSLAENCPEVKELLQSHGAK